MVMMSTLLVVGIVIFILSRMLKKNLDNSPGNKNWLYHVDDDIQGMKREMSEMEYLHDKAAVCDDRVERLERDLERMDAVINMYREFATIHREEHGRYPWERPGQD